MQKEVTKTQRIIIIYHFFRNCQEVSIKELEDNLKNYSKKTFFRDIALLKMAGVPIRYSAKNYAFVLKHEGFDAPELPKGKSELRYIKKLMRIFTIINDIPLEDCDKWYADTFPDVSKRTMQRDFAELTKIGYRIKFERSEFNNHDVGTDVPYGHYYCDRPNGAYGLFLNY